MRQIARFTAICLVLMGIATPATAEPPDVAIFGQQLGNPDGALSILSNPAGLAQPIDAELRLQFANGGAQLGNSAYLGRTGAGWGAFGSTRLGPIGLGAGLQHTTDAWIGAPALSISRASLGAALAFSERYTLGAAQHWTADLNGDLRAGLDVGVLARPWSWLSAGLTARSLAGTTAADPMRLGVGIALRPIAGSDRLTAAGDLEWLQDGALRNIATSLDFRVVHGIHVLAQHQRIASGFGTEDQRTSLLVRLGFGQWGFDVGGHLGQDRAGQSESGQLVGVRWSTDHVPTWVDTADPAVLVWLRGEMSEKTGHGGSHFGRVLLGLQQIAQQRGTHVVVLRSRALSLDWAQVEELRNAIEWLRKSGKQVLFYGDELGTRSLAVAAACNQVWMPSAGQISARGIGSDFRSLADTLAKIGVTVQVVRFRDHKSAGEPLVNREPSAELQATLQHAVERRWQDFAQAVSLGRDVSPSALESLLASGLSYPADAKAARLIDAVVEPGDLDRQLRHIGWLEDDEHLVAWSPPVVRRTQWGRQPQVAVLEVEGSIADHEDGRGLTGRSVGGSQMAKVIEGLRTDPAVRGVVARIASGGGSVIGSEAMREALVQTSRAKPTATSMGGIAASGGYWTALGTRTLWADRATVTGSIGILLVRPEASSLLDRVGVRTRHFGAGPHHDLERIDQPWNPQQLRLVQAELGKYYGLFLDLTAKRRGLTVPEVDAIAGGRVWFGDEARAHKLVDRTGGLLAAIEDIKQQAGLQDNPDVAVRFVPEPTLAQRIQGAIGLSAAEVTGTAEIQQWTAVLQRAVGPWLDAATLRDMLATQGPQARTDAPVQDRGP